MSDKKSFIIGSRGSKLALWQAEHVRAKLLQAREDIDVRIEVIKTSGDVLRDAPLAVIGGQGAFTKELEEALLDRRIDIAVHSLKDLPTIIREGLIIAAVSKREDSRDALVLPQKSKNENASIAVLPENAIVGTSSMRRRAQLKFLRPDLRVEELRGNVDTRLRKLDEGAYDAIILACAGLRRLGFEERISAAIPTDEMLPAVSQGALGIETRADDEASQRLVAALDDLRTRQSCEAERALLRTLGGGCQVPIAAYAVVRENRLTLNALVASPAGDELLRDSIETEATRAAHAGETLAARMIERGADKLLASLSNQTNG